MSDLDKKHTERAKAHWDVQGVTQAQTWTSNKTILFHVLRNITGTTKFWLQWLIEDQINRPIGNVLSLGCGNGSHEFMMAKTGRVAHIDAFDISSASIANARERAVREGVDCISFEEKSFEEFVDSPPEKIYDLICFFGSLHHVKPIEEVLLTCRSLMNENSLLAFNEYTGYMYALPNQDVKKILNSIHECIHPDFRNPNKPILQFLDFEHMLKHDPSEGVRAPLILPILHQLFDMTFLKASAGPLLHRFYPYIDPAFSNSSSPEAETVMKLLIFIEDILLKNRIIDPDFHVGVCKLKNRV